MKMNRKRWHTRRTRTVTDLVRSQDQRLFKAASQPGLLAEVIDLPTDSPDGGPKLNSSMFSGTELHRSLAAAARGKFPIPEFAAITRRLLDWLRENGATRIQAELTLECSDLHGQCDLYVHGARFGERGVVEVKACDVLPSAPDPDDRLQLALYLHAAASQRHGDYSQWGALAYCSLQSGSLRVFLWKTMHVHAYAVGMAIRMAA
jgi:hypothetical protein